MSMLGPAVVAMPTPRTTRPSLRREEHEREQGLMIEAEMRADAREANWDSLTWN